MIDCGFRIGDCGLGSFGREAAEDVKHEDMKHEEALRAVGSFGKPAEGTEVMLQAAWAKGIGTQARRGGSGATVGSFGRSVLLRRNKLFVGGASAVG